MSIERARGVRCLARLAVLLLVPRAGALRSGDALLPLMSDCEIDLYLSGHEHHQENLQAGSLHQIVQGAAGKLRGVATRASITPARQLFSAARPGCAILEVNRDAIDMEFFGYPEGNPRAFGSIYRTTIPSRCSAATARR